MTLNTLEDIKKYAFLCLKEGKAYPELDKDWFRTQEGTFH